MHKRKNLIVRLLIFVLFVALGTGVTDAENIIYVDANGTADYLTIQQAIDVAVDGDIVLVAPGTYTGDGNRDIDFRGKAITVQSKDGYKTCIIDCQGSLDEHHCGFHFQNYEDANSVIQGFTITNGYGPGGITCYKSSPLIVDCLIKDNTALQSGGGIRCLGSNSIIIRCHIRNNNAELLGGGIFITLSGNTISQPKLINCIITGNNSKYGGGLSCSSNNVVLVNCTISGNQASLGGGGVYFESGHSGKIYNSILYGNVATTGREIAMFYFPGRGGCPEYPFLNITHSIVGSDPNAIAMIHCPDLISGEWLHVDPNFVYSGYWADANDPNIIAVLGTPYGEPNDPNAVWIDGDYHLKSQAGRYDPNSQSWVIDDVTSPCIDAGDPNSTVGEEPEPNGGRINMGAYGGTAEASKSYLEEQ